MSISRNLKDLADSELFKGSLILLILLNIGNVINYLFQFIMARMLGPADYGILAVLTSIIYIFSIPTSSIQTIVSKYSTKFNINREFSKIKGVVDYLLRKTLLASLIIFLIYLPIAGLLSKYLNIQFWILAITGLFLFAAFLYPIGAGVAQGMKKFKVLGWNFVLNCSIKLVLAVILLLLGFRVYGAIIGFILGTFIAFIFIFPFIKEVTNAPEIKEKVRIFNRETIYALIGMLVVVLMYSIDVIIAKGAFSPDIAGRYAVISMIGKIILFSSLSIGNAMFPISSEKFAGGDKEKTRGVLIKTSVTIALMCIAAVILFALFPKLIISILFGSQYASLSDILVYVGISFSFISFTNLLLLYKISVNELKLSGIAVLLFFLALQTTLMITFNSSLTDFTRVFVISSILCFIGVIFTTWKK